MQNESQPIKEKIISIKQVTEVLRDIVARADGNRNDNEKVAIYENSLRTLIGVLRRSE